ncbi:3728_t:CDS:2, partial [Racocetra fulgida]
LASSVYVVTNNPSYQSFISWADKNGVPRSNIANDKMTTYTIPKNEISKYGILTINNLNDNGLFEITDFSEKPNPESTNSRNACPCFYFLKREALPLIEEFLKDIELKGAKLEDKDATGKFLAW